MTAKWTWHEWGWWGVRKRSQRAGQDSCSRAYNCPCVCCFAKKRTMTERSTCNGHQPLVDVSMFYFQVISKGTEIPILKPLSVFTVTIFITEGPQLVSPKSCSWFEAICLNNMCTGFFTCCGGIICHTISLNNSHAFCGENGGLGQAESFPVTVSDWRPRKLGNNPLIENVDS